MKILCWIKHNWTPVKAFSMSEIFTTWVVYKGYECKRCGKRKITRDGGMTDSAYAANLAYDWLNETKKKQSAQIIKLVK